MAVLPAATVMTPKQRYERDLTKPGFVRDSAQERAVERLTDLQQRLAERTAAERRAGPLARTLGRIKRSPRTPVRGLYLWGGVGRGKTYLMDMFYECVLDQAKLRMHFHRFMYRVHADLTRLAGRKNPLDGVADGLAAEARLLCFDEFFVADIGDAMILGELLEKLFARGVTLVATSNIEPRRLYENGLQRQRFLPAIAQLDAHTEVLKVDGGIDHRLRALEQAEIYHHPLGEDAERALRETFDSLIHEAASPADVLLIAGREIPTRATAEDVAWFDFAALCDGPRSASDYVELARIYHAVLLSKVPQLGSDDDDRARRFISLVDEFYDRSVKLIISAAVPITELYVGTRLAFEFERTRSRLLEMQSHEYLARRHEA